MDKIIRIGVSSCLIGQNVRYDGGHRLNSFVAETLAQKFELFPVCPEFELGMGVPRETVDLVGDPNNPSMVGTQSEKDWTLPMNSWAEQRIKDLAELNLCGFVFKKGSPSCGVRRVPIIQDNKAQPLEGRGLFASAYMLANPLVPVEDELRLEDPLVQDEFLNNVLSYAKNNPE